MQIFTLLPDKITVSLKRALCKSLKETSEILGVIYTTKNGNAFWTTAF